ncbi:MULTISPECIES: formate/nitrite transporter family protein [Fictibacillus]|jgi:formate transporter|uniref:formate/nitrite transporter family protein n=1 Tax=Fictibacillus TaxID=1329200 RepID=UPI0018CE394A|nr:MULTISPECIES: formate/nitrite transporter family protein [unclassified Fictibacillus]MBH0157968.1 formate/nitrite transporter family protein [Fictibacillus sp. 5RED26]MBH0159629.1 formate/nitrite transporter family protein [Fictibacillus sp. 26RED30]MBH0163571.1 formate/nitrite transporter family protein [Fictibacillus sp. 7GRE50]MBH0175860.1 formate/nitrite transporter family protein [Fictibacillus sp. 23RED33]
MKENQDNKNNKKADIPDRQYFFPVQIIEYFIEEGKASLQITNLAQFILSFMAGAFIAFGALGSVLLSMGVDTTGTYNLLSGVGFAIGYTMIFLSGSILFTEINVLLPSYILQSKYWISKKVLRFWGICYIGNFLGALFVGFLLNMSGSLDKEFYETLLKFMEKKMEFTERGTWGWFQVLFSGILANWLIGIAAVLATAARDVMGKIFGILLPVIIFEAGNFQHAVANMGYFSITVLEGFEYSWYEFILLNLIPATIGNLIGGGILVSLLLSFAFKEDIDDNIVKEEEEEVEKIKHKME